jgi:hypothetical protein
MGVEDTATQFFGRGSNGVDRIDDVVHQLVHVERAAVGKFSFGQRPDPFVRIEVRGVSRKVLHVQAAVSAEELAERRAVVGGGVVEQNDDRTAQMAEPLAEKSAHFFWPDVVEVKQIVETQVLSLGADRDSRDDRDFVPAPLAMTLSGSTALGCPSLGHQGS